MGRVWREGAWEAGLSKHGFGWRAAIAAAGLALTMAFPAGAAAAFPGLAGSIAFDAPSGSHPQVFTVASDGPIRSR
jgi:hypothetical protein